jgi:hypothetical protein
MKCQSCGRPLSAVDSDRVCFHCAHKCVDCGEPCFQGRGILLCGPCSGSRQASQIREVDATLSSLFRTEVVPMVYQRR